MRPNEFETIRSLIRAAWPVMLTSQHDIRVWFETFRNYDFAVVEIAVKDYIKNNKFRPTPADIFDYIPAAKPAPAFIPRFEVLPNGRKQRVISCRKCNDLGLVIWEDENQCLIGRPCTCAAAIANYGAATRERKEA